MRNNKTTAVQPLRANEISWILEQQFTAGIEKTVTDTAPAKKTTKKKSNKKKTEDK
jgi:hypothetical protein